MKFASLVSIAAFAAAASSPTTALAAGNQHSFSKCHTKNHKKPNFVVFLTDDQDHLMDSLKYQ
ncbi:hypothetical protein GGI12_004013, partial [Dipsacomyces acuminosporus]